jgi:hypothetical protein
VRSSPVGFPERCTFVVQHAALSTRAGGVSAAPVTLNCESTDYADYTDSINQSV